MRTPPALDYVVDGMTFRARSWNPAADSSASAYVLIHGIGMSHRYLRRLAGALDRGARVITIDLPGFGGVPKPRGTPTIAEMARGIGATADHLGVRRAALIGHSMGSQWVVETAVQRPDLVRAVVAIGPVADDQHRTAFAQMRALALDIVIEPVDANALVFMDYVRCGPIWFLRQLRHMLDYPIEDAVAQLEIPFVVVRGATDPIAGAAWSRRLRERASVGRVVSIPGHRHNAHYSAPRAVASAIATLIGRP